jgi:hypothetical protein
VGDVPIGSEVVRALEMSWEAIRGRHPDVPAAVMITGAGSGGHRAGLRLGHFAASRWQLSAAERVAELFVGGEGLERGGAEILGTLLHEAAHGLAYVRQIRESSRQGRYHNRRFCQLAEEVGLEVEHHASLGWSLTRLPVRTAVLYAAVIEQLERAVVVHREREQPRVAGHRGRSVVCTCECERRIRIAPSVLAAGSVVCGVCGQPFQHRGV